MLVSPLIRAKLAAKWEQTKAFFKYSESILLARMEMLVGLSAAGISVMDWSPLISMTGISTGFDWKQGSILGGMLFGKGVLSEWARRRNEVNM